MTTTAQFDRLLAVSDALVMTACQRAYSRAISRRSKYVSMRDRHRAYEQYPIPEEKIESALNDAWVLCPTLASRHNLGVDVTEWVGLLDGYTRSLLLMSMPHSATRLGPYLDRLFEVAAPEVAHAAVG